MKTILNILICLVALGASAETMVIPGNVRVGGTVLNYLTDKPETLLLSTNAVTVSTNRVLLGTFPSFTRGSINGYTNAYTGLPVLPNYGLQLSTNSGVDWFDGTTFSADTSEAINGTVMVSLYDANGTSGGYASNILVYGFATNATVGDVDLFGVNLIGDTGTNSRSYVNRDTATNIASEMAFDYVSDWAAYPASERPQLRALGLAWSQKWSTWHSASSNTTTLNFGPYGQSMFAMTANDVTDTNLTSLFIESLNQGATSVVMTVASSNVVAAIVPQSTTNLADDSWADLASYTSTYPNSTNGIYTLTWDLPDYTPTYYRVRSAAGGTDYSTVRQFTLAGDVTITGSLTGTNAAFEGLNTTFLGVASINSDNRTLHDNNGLASVDWVQRRLSDDWDSVAVNWNQRQLLSGTFGSYKNWNLGTNVTVNGITNSGSYVAASGTNSVTITPTNINLGGGTLTNLGSCVASVTSGVLIYPFVGGPSGPGTFKIGSDWRNGAVDAQFVCLRSDNTGMFSASDTFFEVNGALRVGGLNANFSPTFRASRTNVLRIVTVRRNFGLANEGRCDFEVSGAASITNSLTVVSGVITNGAQIWLSSTNTIPTYNANYVTLATSTNYRTGYFILTNDGGSGTGWYPK